MGTLRPKYPLYGYMEPLGLGLYKGSIRVLNGLRV